MQDMRITKSDREDFVRLLAEYGLTRGGVKAAVGEFLKAKDWDDTRAVRVKLLARMRSCNPNYAKCKEEYRKLYDAERSRLRSETAERHLTRALARDRHLAKVMTEALGQLQLANAKEAGLILRAIAELVKTELEVERHERSTVGSGGRQDDTGAVREVESAGTGGVVRELVDALAAIGETEGDV